MSRLINFLLLFSQLFVCSCWSRRLLDDDFRRAGPVDLGTVSFGTPFNFDVTSYFPPNNEYLSLIGLASGSGLTIRRSGILEGTLTAADRTKVSAGTLAFTVLARNSKQQLIQRDFALDIGSPTPITRPQIITSAITPQIPTLAFRSINVNHNISDVPDACQGRLFRFSAARYFTSTNGEALSYSLTAGNVGAFFIDPVTGDITGMIDLSTALPQQPMEMSVTAQDSSNLASFKLRVNFRKPGLLSATSRPVVPKAYVGVAWIVDVGSSFSSNGYPITITWDIAPPLGTGLRLISSDSSTYIRGVPTQQDFLGQRQLAIKADDGCNTATMAIPITVSLPSPPMVLPCNTVVPPAYLGRAWFWDASACFQSETTLKFALSGLAVGTGLSIHVDTGDITGTISAADASVTDYPWSVTVTATTPPSEGALSSNMTFFLYVKIPVNPIVLTPRNGQLPSLSWVNQTLSINYAALFQSKNTLLYSITGLPDNSGLFFSESLGTLAGTVKRDSAAAPQPVTLKITADDLMGGVASLSHNITFIFPNIPQWLPFDVVPPAYFGVPYSLNLYQRFQDPGQLNMTLSGLPAGSGLVFNVTVGVLSGTPTQVDVNTSLLVLTLQVDDGRGGMGAFPVTVPVLDYQSIIEQPLPTDAAFVNTSFSLSLTQYFQARMGRVLVINVTGLPASFSFNPATGLVTGTPTIQDFQATQPIPVLIQVSDGVSQIKRTWMLSIVQPNNPPIASAIPPADATAGIYFLRDIKPYFRDPDNNTLVYSLAGLTSGSGLTFDGVNGILSGTPNFGDVTGKPAALTITANDGRYKGTVQGILQLTVRPVNNAPFISLPIPSPATAVAGRRFSGLLSQHFVDPDRDPLTFSVTGLPPGSGLTMDQTGQLSGFPNTQDLAASPIRVNVKVDDGRGGIVFGSFDLIVQEQISAPVALPIPPLKGQEGEPIFLNLKQYFQTSVPLQYVIDGLPTATGIQVGFDSGLIAGVPTKADVTGPSSRTVTVYVHNEQGGKTQTTFPMQILPVNRAPVALPIPNLQATVGQPFTFDFTKFFSDPNLATLAYTISGLPRNSGLSLSPQGIFSGTPSAADGNTSPLTLTVVANNGGLQTFSIFVLTVAKNYKAPNSDPIPDSKALMGVMLRLDMKPYFHSSTLRPLQFSVTGLPPNSGLSMDRVTGILGGIPSPGDFVASANGKTPMRLLVLANEGGPNANSSLLLTIRDVNSGPTVSTTIPPATATVGEVFVYDVASAFNDPDDDSLVYGMAGMPQGSGLSMEPSEGVIHGIPQPAACLWSMPINLFINASDGLAPAASTTLALTISCGEIGVHFVGSIPDGLAYIGKLWLLDVSPFFQYNGPYSLRFSAVGFPPGSGFTVAANGIAYGQPNQADCRAFSSSRVIQIRADDGHSHSDVGYFPFLVDCSGKTGAVSPFVIPPDAFVHPLMTVYVGNQFSFDVSQGFLQLMSQGMEYTATGLSPTSGIKFDSSLLRLYGIPTAQDCANNPITVLITGQNGKIRRQSVVFLTFPSCQPLINPAPAFGNSPFSPMSSLSAQPFNFPPISGVSFPDNSPVTLPLSPFPVTSFTPVQISSPNPIVTSPISVPPSGFGVPAIGGPPATGLMASGVLNSNPVSYTPSQSQANPNQAPISISVTADVSPQTRPSGPASITPSQPQTSLGNPLQPPVFTPSQPQIPGSPGSQTGTARFTPSQPQTSSDAQIDIQVGITGQATGQAQPGQPDRFTPSQPQTSQSPQFSLPQPQPQINVQPPQGNPQNSPPQLAPQQPRARMPPQLPPQPIQSTGQSQGARLQPGARQPADTIAVSVTSRMASQVSVAANTSSCAELGWAIPPESKNATVCSSDSIPSAAKCSPISYAVAQKMCTELGGRVCTATELEQDVAIGGSCDGLDMQLVWSQTPCQSPSGTIGVLTAGGSSASVLQGSCVVEPSTTNPVRCCADFLPGMAFSFGGTVYNSTGNTTTATLAWTWLAYPSFEVAVQSTGGKWNKSTTISAGEPFSFTVKEPTTVRIVPVSADKKPEKKQARMVNVNVA